MVGKMCLFKRDKKPEIELLSTNSATVRQEVADLKLLYPVLLDDLSDYYYTNAEGWAEVFNYIYFKFKMPSYISGRMDCDDFALLMKGLVSAFFGLSYFGLVMGVSPNGYHAWNIFRAENGLLQLEPQTGHFFPMYDEGYKAEYILV